MPTPISWALLEPWRKEGRGVPVGLRVAVTPPEAGGLVMEKTTLKLISGSHTIPCTVLAVVSSPVTHTARLCGVPCALSFCHVEEEPEPPHRGL